MYVRMYQTYGTSQDCGSKSPLPVGKKEHIWKRRF